MKKLASIVGIGVISMSVALAPAFAQQAKPLDQPGAAATVQPKTDTKSPAVGNMGKDEKNMPKPEVKNEIPAKPAPDAKGSMATVQPKTDTKSPAVGNTGKDEKNMPKPEVKSEGLPGKSAPEVKGGMASDQPKTDTKAPGAGLTSKDEKNVPAKTSPDAKNDAVSGKSSPTVQDQKSAPVKPGAALKNEKPAKSVHQAKADGKRTHKAMKTSHKHASAKHTKKVTSHNDTEKKVN